MIKTLLVSAGLLCTSALFSQIFTDNFDSYTAGDYLVPSNPAWSTWSNQAGGGSEDVKISNADAASVPNSLYFSSSSANGGPTDIILKFEDVYTSGIFTLDFNMKVEAGKGAYFNLQQNHTVGQVWALQGYFIQDGTFKFDNGSTGDILLTGSYPNGEWCNVKLEIDLTSNLWEVKIDDVSSGTFSNPVNSIGIWDIYPVNPASMGGNNQSGFYIDDVSYNQVPATLSQLNGGVSLIYPINGLAGQEIPIKAQIRNLGEDNISSYDLTYSYVGGVSETEHITGVNIASLDYDEVTFSTPLSLVPGNNTLSVTISNVNGQEQDDNPSDDTKTFSVNPKVPAEGKMVVGEEATGTWCQWCPRGAVFMDMMAEKYDGYWVGIAVHNGDPMVHQAYDQGIGTKIAGYPSALVDRGSAIDPSELEEDFLTRIMIEPTAIITNGAAYNTDTRELKVSLTYRAESAINGNWKVACVLTEDGVSGTASGYAQQNAYSGGASGIMGGYESLPNPVPASQMVYNHVARTIAPSFGGDASLIPNMATGEEHTVNFTFNLPSSWDEDNMHIVGLLINPQGRIDNAGYTTIDEAVANGFIDGTEVPSGIEDYTEENTFTLYPNPTSNVVFVDINTILGENVQLTVLDLTGKVVAQRSYSISENSKLPIATNNFSKGTYVVKVEQGNNVMQKKLIVQ